jgi:hypothetical protein
MDFNTARGQVISRSGRILLTSGEKFDERFIFIFSPHLGSKLTRSGQ